MADTESIMRLGIEAARAGDKDEARNLFRLLTREQPDNTQAWLWLAGVAEDREEKRAALERVLALEPTSELARKGLQALGVTAPATALAGEEQPFATRQLSHSELEEQGAWAAEEPEMPVLASYEESGTQTAEEEFSASLDSIGSYENFDGGESAEQGSYSLPDFGEEDADLESYMNRPRVRAEDIDLEDAEPAAEPQRRSNLLPIAIIVAAAIILGVLVAIYLGRDSGMVADSDNTPAAGSVTPAATAAGGGAATTDTADSAGEATQQPAETAAGNNTPGPAETTPAAPAATPTTAPPAATPTTAPPPPPGDLANANPQPVAPNTVLNASGWAYNFPAAAYSTVIPGAMGGMQAQQGNWLVALIVVYNETGQPQTLPADFFALRDAQGRVYMPNLDASETYINTYGRGIAADYSQKDQLPAAVNVSVPLVFDVPSDASNLVLFSKANLKQGYVVQQNMQP